MLITGSKSAWAQYDQFASLPQTASEWPATALLCESARRSVPPLCDDIERDVREPAATESRYRLGPANRRVSARTRKVRP
jgi:hypothetical protein